MNLKYRKIILVFILCVSTYIAYTTVQVANEEALSKEHEKTIFDIVKGLNTAVLKDCMNATNAIRQGNFNKPKNLLVKIKDDKLYSYGDYEYSDFTVEFSIDKTVQNFRLYSLIKDQKCFGIFEKL